MILERIDTISVRIEAFSGCIDGVLHGIGERSEGIKAFCERIDVVSEGIDGVLEGIGEINN
jgi:hypothetical protein